MTILFCCDYKDEIDAREEIKSHVNVDQAKFATLMQWRPTSRSSKKVKLLAKDKENLCLAVKTIHIPNPLLDWTFLDRRRYNQNKREKSFKALVKSILAL